METAPASGSFPAAEHARREKGKSPQSLVIPVRRDLDLLAQAPGWGPFRQAMAPSDGRREAGRQVAVWLTPKEWGCVSGSRLGPPPAALAGQTPALVPTVGSHVVPPL